MPGEYDRSGERSPRETIDDDRDGPGRQDEPVLLPGSRGDSSGGGQRGDEQESDAASVRGASAVPHRGGGGNTFAVGERLPSCDTDTLGPAQLAGLPEGLPHALRPLLQQVESLTLSIKQRDQHIEQIARRQYPETELLRQISGVGPLIALTFVLTLDDPQRFSKSRDVGCYVGLRPKRSDSGERQPQLGITKEGDLYLRKLLLQGAQHILHRGPDTDLKRWV